MAEISGLKQYEPWTDLDTFEQIMTGRFAQLTEKREGAPFVNVETRRQEDWDFVRFGIRVGQDNPIVLDLKPGPRDEYGNPTVMESYPTGWAKTYEPSIYAWTPDDVEIRGSGVETLSREVKIALGLTEGERPEVVSGIKRLASIYPRSPQKRFNLISWGGFQRESFGEDVGLVGRHAMVGPVHTPRAISNVLSRFSIGYSPEIKDRHEVHEAIRRRIERAASQPEDQYVTGTREQREQTAWRQAARTLPMRDKDNITRLIPVGGVEYPDIDEQELSIWGYGTKAVDMIKRFALSGMRERAHLMELTQEGNLRVAEAKPITEQKARGRAGYRQAGGYRWGEWDQVPSAIVTPNVGITEGTILPGATWVYRTMVNAARAEGEGDIVSAAYATGKRVPLPMENLEAWKNAKFEFGIMRRKKTEEGKYIYEKTRELQGAVIQAGKSQVVGWYQQEGGEQVPIRLKAGGSSLALRGVNIVAPAYMTGAYEAHTGIPTAGDIKKGRAIVPTTEIVESLRAANQGLSVLGTGDEKGGAIFDVSLLTGWGEKGAAFTKASKFVVPQIETPGGMVAVKPKVFIDSPESPRTSVMLNAITGEVKERTGQFAEQYLFSSREAQIEWMGELEKYNRPEYTTAARNIQGYLRGLEGKPYDPRDMAQIWARDVLNKQYLPRERAEDEYDVSGMGKFYYQDIMSKLRFATEQFTDPVRSYQRYGYAVAGVQETERAAVSGVERQQIIRSTSAGMRSYWQDLVEKGEVSPLTTSEGRAQWRQYFPKGIGSVIGFDYMPGAKTPYMYKERGPITVGAEIETPVSEFRGGSLRLGEVMLTGLQTQWRKISEAMGLGPRATRQEEEAAGWTYRPQRTEAYEQLSDIVRYRLSKENVRVPGATVISPEQAETILGKLQALDVDEMGRRNLEEVEKLFPEGEGVLASGRGERGREMVRPRLMGALSYSPYTREDKYYDPVDQLTRQYVPALKSWLNYVATGREDPRLISYEKEMMEPFKSATNIIKDIQADTLHGGVSGRFGAVLGLGLKTGLIQQEELNRRLTQLARAVPELRGRELREWKKAARRQVEEIGGLPELATRAPFQDPRNEWLAQMAITPQMARKKFGLSFAEGLMFRGGQILGGNPYVSNILEQMGIGTGEHRGDFDLDLLMSLVLGKANPRWREEGQSPLLIPEPMREAVAKTERERLEEIPGRMAELTGPGITFDPIAQAGKVLAGAASAGPRPEPQPSGIYKVPYKEMWGTAFNFLMGGKGSMGQEYNLQLAMQGIGASLGRDPKEMAWLRTASGGHYHQPLDFMWKLWQGRGGPTRLAQLVQSATFVKGVMPETWALKAILQPGKKHEQILEEGQPGNVMGVTLAETLQKDINELAQPPAPEFAGGMLAQRSGDLERVTKMYQEAYEQDPRTAVVETFNRYNQFLRSQDIVPDPTRSILGMLPVDAALRRMTGIEAIQKPGKKVTLPNAPDEEIPALEYFRNRAITLQGQQMSIGQAAESLQFTVSSAVQQELTKKGRLLPEQVTALQEFSGAIEAQGGREAVPYEISTILGRRYPTEGDVAAITQARTGQVRTPSQISAFLANTRQRLQNKRIRVSASQLPYIAADRGFQQTNLGTDPRRIQSAEERLLLENVTPLKGEQIDELLSIPPELAQAGNEFEAWRTQRIKRASFLTKVPRGQGAVIPLSEMTTPEELSEITSTFPEGTSLDIGFTPDPFYLTNIGQRGERIVQTEMKWGSNREMALRKKAGAEKTQAALYGGFMWHRFAKYGGPERFREVMKPMLMLNPKFAALPETAEAGLTSQETILDKFFQNALQNRVETLLIAGTGKGTSAEPFETVEETAINPDIVEGEIRSRIADVGSFFTSEKRLEEAYVGAETKRLAKPKSRIPTIAPASIMNQINQKRYPRTRIVRTSVVTETPAEEQEPETQEAATGGGQPPSGGEPPVTTAAPGDQEEPSRRWDYQPRSRRREVDVNGERLARTLTGVGEKEWVNVYFQGGPTRPQLGKLEANLKMFRGLYQAASQTPAALGFETAFNAMFGTGSEDLTAQIAAAQMDPVKLREFLAQNRAGYVQLQGLHTYANRLSTAIGTMKTATQEDRARVISLAGLGGVDAAGSAIERTGMPLVGGSQLAGSLAELTKMQESLTKGTPANVEAFQRLEGFTSTTEQIIKDPGLFRMFLNMPKKQRDMMLERDTLEVQRFKMELAEKRYKESPNDIRLAAYKTAMDTFAKGATSLEDLEVEADYEARMDPIRRVSALRATDIEFRAGEKDLDIRRRYKAGKKGESASIKQLYEQKMAGLRAMEEKLQNEVDSLLSQFEELPGQEEIQTAARGVRAAPPGERARAARRLEQLAILQGTPEEAERATGLRQRIQQQETLPEEREEVEAAYQYHPGRGLGGLARRMFGGFGLMYMRSIAGLMGQGAYTGYAERFQMAGAMAEPFLQLGGERVVPPTERIRRIEATQYGGAGGMLMQQARAEIMQKAQPVYNLATTALAGVTAAGTAAWLGPNFDIPQQYLGRFAIGAGLAVAGAQQALNIFGAYQDVEGTAMSLAVKRARGENTNAAWLAAIGASTASGAVVGGAMGAVPGAIVGGLGGLAIGAFSNYQQIAANLNPEIQKQEEILTAIATRGNEPLPSILQRYGIPEEEYAYYGRISSMIEASRTGNEKISDQGFAAAAAFELRRKTNLGEEGRVAYARQAEAGFNPEAMAMTMTQLMGIPLAEATRVTETRTYTERVPVTQQKALTKEEEYAQAILATPQEIVQAERAAQSPELITRTITEEKTLIGELTKAVSQLAATEGKQFEIYEKMPAALDAIAKMGAVGMKEFRQATTGLAESEIPLAALGLGMQYQQMQASGWATTYMGQQALQIQRRGLGLSTQQISRQDYANRPFDLQRIQDEEALLAAQQAETGVFAQARSQAYVNFGTWRTPGVQTTAGAQQFITQGSYGAGVAQQLITTGMGEQEARAYGRGFQYIAPETFRGFQNLLSGNPLQQAGYLMQNPIEAANIVGGGMLPGLGGSQINPLYMGMADVNAQGALTGLGWGRSSLAMPAQVSAIQGMTGMTPQAATAMSSQLMATRIWGQYQNRGNVDQGLIAAMIGGGQYGAQQYQQNLAAGYQQQMAGIQGQQLQIQAQFTPQFWALEDRSRALSYRQTEWGFQYSGMQMALQREQMEKSMALQQQQMGMQRQWTREDWAFQDQTRSLQWGWRQEDFQEQVRFMSGRQRKLAERGMERETIMFNLETDQIERQRTRQEEMWKLEDARFKLQKQQSMESLKLQEENLQKQRQFFEERKKLEAEQVALQREQWKANHALAVESHRVSTQYSLTMQKVNQTMLEFGKFSDEASAQGNLFNVDTLARLLSLIKEFSTEFLNAMRTGNEQDKKPIRERTPRPRATGGPVGPGEEFVAGEDGGEILQRPYPVSVLSNNMLVGRALGAVDDAMNPWQSQLTQAPLASMRQEKQGPTTLVVNIGNERLAKFVLNAFNDSLEIG